MNSQPRRRLRRRSTDNDNDAVTDFLRRSATEPSSPPQDVEPHSEVLSPAFAKLAALKDILIRRW
jgi:hypothetical protein